MNVSSAKSVIFFNTISQLFGKAFNGFITFLVSIVLVKELGASGYGDFIKITTYIGFFYLLSDFGFNALYLKSQYTKTTVTWPQLLGTRITWSLFLSLVAAAILILIPSGTNQGYTTLVKLGILLYSPAILVQAIITTTNAIFQKQQRYDLATIAAGLGSFVGLCLILYIIRGVVSPNSPIIASEMLLVSAIISAVVAMAFVHKIYGHLGVTLAISPMKRLFMASMPLGLTLLFNQILFRADSFILTITRSTLEVGFYGFAYKFFEVVLVFPTFFMNSLYPLLLQAEKKSTSSTPHMRRFTVKAAFILVLTSLIAMVGSWLMSPFIVYINPTFVGSVLALRILSLGFPFFFLSALAMWLLIVINKQNMLPLIYGLALVVTVPLYIIFIPRVGYVAAAWITVFSEGFVLIISSFVIYKERKRLI